MREMWNEKFGGSNYWYGMEPNPSFKSFIDGLTFKGTIFFPGEGEGRNAVYAASLGWDVIAMDFSESARKKALSLASERGVNIEYHLGSVEMIQEDMQFDVIALVFLHLNEKDRQVVHRKLEQRLKPGGKIFVIGFSKEQLKYNSGGPKLEEMLYDTEMLLNDFSPLKVIQNDTLITTLNEGEGHKGKASVSVFIAEKSKI